MRFGATQVHIDPGPGALVRALGTVPPERPAELDAIVLSHKHLDHAGDGQRDHRSDGAGRLEAARRAVRTARCVGRRFDPAALRRAISYRGTRSLMSAAGPLRDQRRRGARASIRHQHPLVETYGLHFRYEGTTVSYLPCTRYFEGLIEDYRAHAPDVLVINVLRYADSMDVDHLTLEDAKRLIGGIRPRSAIMTHFGTKMLERDPRRLAYDLEDELGIRVYAARDGWTYDAPTRLIDA